MILDANIVLNSPIFSMLHNLLLSALKFITPFAFYILLILMPNSLHTHVYAHENQKIVVLEIHGSEGLGNQLFQFAASYELSRRIGAEQLWAVVERSTKYRKFHLDQFRLYNTKTLYTRLLTYKEYKHAIEKSPAPKVVNESTVAS